MSFDLLLLKNTIIVVEFIDPYFLSKANFMKTQSSVSRHGSSGFTLVELLVVIAIIGVLVALLLPAVQQAREAARRMQCTNHLKQIGLAVHNFADSRNGLPPSTIGYSGSGGHQPRPSFWILILPFMEQQAAYDLIETRTDKFLNPVYNDTFWNTLTLQERDGLQFSGYICPSRRGRADTMLVGAGSGQGGLHGPRGDYAYVQGRQNQHWAQWLTTNHDPNGTEGGGVNNQRGPFRVARWNAGNPVSWSPRDTFSWMQDGTSNQILVGEKQIHKDNINICPASPGGDVNERAKQADCSIISTGDWNTIPSARSFNAGIARSNMEMNTFAETGPQWGSNHPGVCNFLIGDGSVRAISVTIPTGNGPAFLLSRLGNVSDGNPVSFEQ